MLQHGNHAHGIRGPHVPAESAAIPNLVGEGEALITANAMNSATWSASLAIGAALGGFVVAIWY